MRPRPLVFLAVLYALLVSCAAAPPTVKTTDLHRVALVMVVPDELGGKFLGVTIFNNSFFAVDAKPYGLTELLKADVNKELAAGCHWQVAEAHYDQAKLWQRYWDATKSRIFASADGPFGPISADLSQIVRDTSSDAAIVVVPAPGARPEFSWTSDLSYVFAPLRGVDSYYPTAFGFTDSFGPQPLTAFVAVTAYVYREHQPSVELGDLWALKGVEGVTFKSSWKEFPEPEQQQIVAAISALISEGSPRICKSAQARQ